VPPAMFGVVPIVVWNILIPADVNNHSPLAMCCLLIEDGNRLLLNDTGIVNKQDAKFMDNYHLHGTENLHLSLHKHGSSKEDITDVFLTHLHFDHVGGAVTR